MEEEIEFKFDKKKTILILLFFGMLITFLLGLKFSKDLGYAKAVKDICNDNHLLYDKLENKYMCDEGQLENIKYKQNNFVIPQEVLQ